MPEFVPGSDYVQDNGDGSFSTVVGGNVVYRGPSQSEAENAFNKAKGGGGGGGTAGAITPEHRDGLRRAGYPNWADPNLTEADFQRISSGAQRGGGGAGGIGAGAGMGNLNILPIEQMRLAIELANQEYLRKRLELLEIPEMQRRLELEGRNTENDRHKIALDAATSFAQVSGWFLPGSFIENMVFQEYPGMVEGVTPVYPKPGQQPGQQPGPGQVGIGQPMPVQPLPPGTVTALSATGGQPAGGTGGGVGGTMLDASGRPIGGTTTGYGTGRVFKDAKGQTKTVDDLKNELKAAGWPGPGPGKTADTASVDELVAAYKQTTGASLTEITEGGGVGGAPGWPTLPPQYPGAPSWAYDQKNWMPTLDREKWWFDKQKYLTDLAANPRNLTQALLMLGMSPDQVSSFLANSPSVNYLLNQGGWNVNLDPGAPSPYWDRTTGLPITPGSGPTPGGIPGQPGSPGQGKYDPGQPPQPGMIYDWGTGRWIWPPIYGPMPMPGQTPGMVYDIGGPPGGKQPGQVDIGMGPPLPTMPYTEPGGGQIGIPGGVPAMSPENPLLQNPAIKAQATGGMVSALGALASPTIGGTTMPTDYNGSFDFSQYFRPRPANDERPGGTGQSFDWRSWIQNNPYRRTWGQANNPAWGGGVTPLPGIDDGSGRVSALGAGGGGGGYMQSNWGYDANGNPVQMGGWQGSQPNVPGSIQDVIRNTPQGPLGTRNPNFPFITGRQLPVRQTLNWMDTNSPMIKLLQGLFSYSGQEPGNAFAEFQSFLPKGTTAGPTSYY